MSQPEICPYCGGLAEIKTEIVEYKFEYVVVVGMVRLVVC